MLMKLWHQTTGGRPPAPPIHSHPGSPDVQRRPAPARRGAPPGRAPGRTAAAAAPRPPPPPRATRVTGRSPAPCCRSAARCLCPWPGSAPRPPAASAARAGLTRAPGSPRGAAARAAGRGSFNVCTSQWHASRRGLRRCKGRSARARGRPRERAPPTPGTARHAHARPDPAPCQPGTAPNVH